MSGHIRRRGTRSWELKFDLGRDPVTAKRQIRYHSLKGTKKEAEIELARLIAQNAAGEGIDPSKETIAEFAQRWDRDWLSLNVSPKSLERYRQILRLYVIPYLGGMRSQKLRAVHLSELYAKLLRSGGNEGRPLAAATVGYAHRVLHRMLGHAATWGVVTTNVAGLVSPPPVPDTEITILNEEQIVSVLRASKSAGWLFGALIRSPALVCSIERSMRTMLVSARFAFNSATSHGDIETLRRP